MRKIIDGILDYIGHAIGKYIWILMLLIMVAIISVYIK